MINEWTYCPRLAWYEWVEGVWAESAETVDGRRIHRRVDAGRGDPIPPPEQIPTVRVVARGVTLSAPEESVIAKMDLVESDGARLRPVDYKRGALPAGGPWPPERVQCCVQALTLRANGYACNEAAIYFAASRRRITFPIDDELIEQTRSAVRQMLVARARGRRPPPLLDSPKCRGCSLAPICLPDETNALSNTAPSGPARPLFPSADDTRPVHIATTGARIRKKGRELLIARRGEELGRSQLETMASLAIYGGVELTTPALRALMKRGVPVSFYTAGGYFEGQVQGLARHGVALRRAQYRAADDEARKLVIARGFVAGKIHNQRTLLRRNHPEPPAMALRDMKRARDRAGLAASISALLGHEGDAAANYFRHFGGLLKTDHGFDFERRNRRPPADPVNAVLSFSYALLTRACAAALAIVGFDPMLGFLHQPRAARPSLALDLMEEFRPLLADSVVLSTFNTGILEPTDFLRAGEACNLTERGRKLVIRAWERRLQTRIRHPRFGYEVNYRQVLEIQARLLARVLMDEIETYPQFRVR